VDQQHQHQLHPRDFLLPLLLIILDRGGRRLRGTIIVVVVVVVVAVLGIGLVAVVGIGVRRIRLRIRMIPKSLLLKRSRKVQGLTLMLMRIFRWRLAVGMFLRR
jgi:hypothetical protein